MQKSVTNEGKIVYSRSIMSIENNLRCSERRYHLRGFYHEIDHKPLSRELVTGMAAHYSVIITRVLFIRLYIELV